MILQLPNVISIRTNGKISFRLLLKSEIFQLVSTKQLLWFYLKKNANLVSSQIYLFVGSLGSLWLDSEPSCNSQV